MNERQVVLVIVGAGASFDCAVTPHVKDLFVRAPGLLERRFRDVRPPLTQDLVQRSAARDDILNEYPHATPIIGAIRRRLEEASAGRALPVTLERAIREFEESGASDPNLGAQMASFRFFLRDVLLQSTDYVRSGSAGGPETNYTVLVTRLYRWACDHHNAHVCFVSFNYDLLLDLACRDHWGMTYTTFDGYLADERASLLKPHGSAQWGWRPAAGEESASIDTAIVKSIEWAKSSATGEMIPFMFAPYQLREIRGTDTFMSVGVPALALPVDEKGEFVWPESHRDHFRGLGQGAVERVLTIGWRGVEPHFVEMLTPLVRERSRILVVTGGKPESDARAEGIEIGKRLLASIAPTTDITYWPSGFGGLMGDPGRLDTFLA